MPTYITLLRSSTEGIKERKGKPLAPGYSRETLRRQGEIYR